MATELTSDDAQRLIEQHRAMEREIDEWREWWHELDELGEPRFEEMGARLRRFHEELRQHFRLEEESGFFDSMLERHPNCLTELAGIRNQHSELLATLNGLVERLAASETGSTTWGAARADFEAFLDSLHEHEVAEHELGGGLEADPTEDRERLT